MVYDGSRQDFNPKTGALNRLDFERYSVDFPEPDIMKNRWKEPDERTFMELLNPDKLNKRDVDNIDSFTVEAHRRIIGPFLTLSFTMIALSFLLLGPANRRGQNKRITIAILAIVLLQGFYLSVFNFADKQFIGLLLMYAIIFVPIIVGLFLLSPYSEYFRRKLLYTKPKQILSDGV